MITRSALLLLLGSILASCAEHEAPPARGAAAAAAVDSGPGGLRLTLQGGRRLEFRNDTSEGGDYVVHSYAGIDSATGYHVVVQRMYETSVIAFVHPRTGITTRMVARPVPSPDGSRLAVATMDFEAGYEPTQLQVWRVDADSIALEWSLVTGESSPMGGWGATDPRWLDAATIEVKRHIPDGDGKTREAGTARIVRAGSTWSLDGR